MGTSGKELREKTARIFRAGRKLYGINQVEMAKTLGITQGTVSKLETAVLAPDAGVWYQFCKHLNLNADLTFSSGFIFDPDLENVQKDKFKLGKKKSGSKNKIKVRNCLPFIDTIYDLEGSENLAKHLKLINIDADVFAVPDYDVPVEVLSEVFNYLGELQTEAKSLKAVTQSFIKYKDILYSGDIESIEMLTDLFRSQLVNVNLEAGCVNITVDLEDNAKINQNFLAGYVKYQSQLIKEIASKVLKIDGISLDKIDLFQYSLRY